MRRRTSELGATVIEYVLVVSGVAIALAFIAAGLVEPLDTRIQSVSSAISQS